MEEKFVDTPVVSPPNHHHIIPLHPRPQAQPAEHVRTYASVDAAVEALRPEQPVHGLRTHSVEQMTAWFLAHFPGDVMFAVKTNPEPLVLDAAYAAGMRHFDVASLAEAELIHARYADATMHFMHPVKSREAIAKAYYYYGIRHFSLDSLQELKKILDVTEHADDLALSVRLAIPNDKAAIKLTGKFGVDAGEAEALIQATRKAAKRFGLCFHVGSQCMDPEAFTIGMTYVRTLLDECRVKLDILDVGGGFPAIYPDKVPPKMITYIDAIRAGLAELPLDEDCQILCEPGRALVAESGSLIVRVELKKAGALYINDGVYGSLFDAGEPAFNYPVRAIRPGRVLSSQLMPFIFYGPTCDSMDVMHGPFMLPADITEGDWIEIGQMGAYGATMRTKFNGFYSDELVCVEDEALVKMEMA